ncbi:MAG: arginine deiminase, partial [Bacteroidetes bacterium]|nr:arginine deiminase [Bacteroidota bacterium]
MIKQTGSSLQVYSEIGSLKRVLLHRPGSELETLTPKYLDTMLFEDIPFLDSMREEHNAFAETLRKNGCDVLYVEDMLMDTVKISEARNTLIEKTVRTAGIPDLDLCETLRENLFGMDDLSLSRHLIAGTKKDEIALNQPTGRRDLSYYIRDEYPFYINPLPNLYFTRDPGSVIGNRCSVNTMQTEARKRESLLLSVIMRYHPIFSTDDGSTATVMEGYAEGSSIEGGDILVLDANTLAVGCSARTEAWAIEELAKQVLTSNPDSEGESSGFKNILVIQIPFTRAYMHLDTVFTMVDHDKFTIYPGVETALKVFTISMGKERTLNVRPEKGLKAALERVLKLPAVDLIQTGGGDRITAAREQWNDSANTLAIAPGVVVTYRRNVVSNDTLEKHGITVLPIQGS